MATKTKTYELEIIPERQRECLREFLARNTPRPVHPHPIDGPIVEAVAQCLRRDEITMGIALVSLITARHIGRIYECAEAILEQTGDQPPGVTIRGLRGIEGLKVRRIADDDGK